MLFPSSDTASALPSTNIPAIAEGFDMPLEKGMVVALEPKIGIPGFGMVGSGRYL